MPFFRGHSAPPTLPIRTPRPTPALALVALLLGLSLVPSPAPSARAAEPAAAQGPIEFRFAQPERPPAIWRLAPPEPRLSSPARGDVPAEPLHLVSADGRSEAWSGSRVVLALEPGTPFPEQTIAAAGLRPDRHPDEHLWILQADSPLAAARAAHSLSTQPRVRHASPVLRRRLALHGSFAPRPDDPYFTEQWHLENRTPTGDRLGPDTNPRAAWTVSRGAGVTIAICDAGFEATHPDLRAAATGAPHFDFTRKTAGTPTYHPHATCVAGLAGATGDNLTGIAGIAPAATLASLTIFDATERIVDEEGLMDMYQYRSNVVQVQNHSWGNSDVTLYIPGVLERTGISNAVAHGRDGRGVVIVRSAGNYRDQSVDANDDGSANDPRVIAVGAVRRNGRVASYSNPGACILVGAPSGDENDPFEPTDTIFTTDQVGSRGYNTSSFAELRPDYAFGNTGFTGTSAAAPQISGLAALVLAANPNLTYRDVQQILLDSARHDSLSAPGLRRNGAGYWVDHDLGFGIPDAGRAVRLAATWTHRPPLTEVVYSTNLFLGIPDDGLRVLATGADGTERSLRCKPSLGLHPDPAAPELPFYYVRSAANGISENLGGTIALIPRSVVQFRTVVRYAADAGAAAVVFINSTPGDELIRPGGLDFSPIPAVVIGATDGQALATRLAGGEFVRARFGLRSVRHAFAVTNTLVCEHVGLRVRSTHTRRGDLRITLVSPSGTRSVLQHLGNDYQAGPADWTYWTVQSFYEPSAGTWIAEFADEAPGALGAVTGIDLILRGVAITDADADGLDDDWEQRWLGSLQSGPLDDPDHDGRTNAREQVLNSDPTHDDTPLRLDLATYDPQGLIRLAWPARDDRDYRLLGTPALGVEPTEISRVPGRFPESDAVVPFDPTAHRFFWLESLAR